MTNHPNRGKLSRHCLELIATLSAGGLALTAEQQQTLWRLCRAAAQYRRALDAGAPPENTKRIEANIREAWAALPTHFYNLYLNDRARSGMAVRLEMAGRLKHLHDADDGVCVPGS